MVSDTNIGMAVGVGAGIVAIMSFIMIWSYHLFYKKIEKNNSQLKIKSENDIRRSILDFKKKSINSSNLTQEIVEAYELGKSFEEAEKFLKMRMFISAIVIIISGALLPVAFTSGALEGTINMIFIMSIIIFIANLAELIKCYNRTEKYLKVKTIDEYIADN